MPPVIIGEVATNANLDDNTRLAKVRRKPFCDVTAVEGADTGLDPRIRRGSTRLDLGGGFTVSPHWEVGVSIEKYPAMGERLKPKRATAMTTELDSGNQTSLAVPRVEFVSNWFHGLTPEQLARDLTGRDDMTGDLTLAVSLRSRHNRAVRFECDLWKLPFDFRPDTVSLLADRSATPIF